MLATKSRKNRRGEKYPLRLPSKEENCWCYFRQQQLYIIMDLGAFSTIVLSPFKGTLLLSDSDFHPLLCSHSNCSIWAKNGPGNISGNNRTILRIWPKRSFWMTWRILIHSFLHTFLFFSTIGVEAQVFTEIQRDFLPYLSALYRVAKQVLVKVPNSNSNLTQPNQLRLRDSAVTEGFLIQSFFKMPQIFSWNSLL